MFVKNLVKLKAERKQTMTNLKGFYDATFWRDFVTMSTLCAFVGKPPLSRSIWHFDENVSIEFDKAIFSRKSSSLPELQVLRGARHAKAT